MPQAQMKWHNFNLAVRIKISTGTGLLIYMAGFFGILLAAKWIPAVASQLTGTLSAWTLGFGGFLAQAHGSNKLDVQTAQAGQGAVTALNEIKVAAAGGFTRGQPAQPDGAPDGK